jgi:hypothetical protein
MNCKDNIVDLPRNMPRSWNAMKRARASELISTMQPEWERFARLNPYWAERSYISVSSSSGRLMATISYTSDQGSVPVTSKWGA